MDFFVIENSIVGFCIEKKIFLNIIFIDETDRRKLNRPMTNFDSGRI